MEQSTSAANRNPWMVSLHGGHSGEFCDHADGTLREILEAAVGAGYHTFGVSEHAPRNGERFLYNEEKALGWDVAKMHSDFANYIEAIQPVVADFADRLIVLRGFEAEVVPTATYAASMRAYREYTLSDGKPAFDYFVGSVHYVSEIQLDGPPENYRLAAEACGGIEALAVRYYETIAEMIAALRPDVVGHLDLIKRNLKAAGFDLAILESPRVHAAVGHTLEVARAHNAILDLNTAGWRKGLGEPYPSPPLVQRAQAMGVPFCFGDDSHRASELGAGVADARDYLLRNGVSTVTVLTREGDPAVGDVVRRVVPLA